MRLGDVASALFGALVAMLLTYVALDECDAAAARWEQRR